MPPFMYQAAYTPESVAAQIEDPQDRFEAVRPAFEALGGKIIGCYPAAEYVHPVQVVSSRPIPSRCRAARRAVAATRFTAVPETQKALSRLGKGLDLRKLVAGEGFEPSTSGL